MHPSQPLAVVVLFLTSVLLLATALSFILGGLSAAAVAVLAVAVLAVGSACVVGAGAARWRSNPYW